MFPKLPTGSLSPLQYPSLHLANENWFTLHLSNYCALFFTRFIHRNLCSKLLSQMHKTKSSPFPFAHRFALLIAHYKVGNLLISSSLLLLLFFLFIFFYPSFSSSPYWLLHCLHLVLYCSNLTPQIGDLI